MSHPRWYLRLGQEILGPLSETELRELAQRGGLFPETPVSPDGTNWTTAASLEGLVFPPPPPPPEPLPAGQRSASVGIRLTPAGLLAGLALGGLGILLCGGLLWLFIAGSSTSPGTEELASLLPTRQQLVAERTLAYWQALGAVLAEDPTATNTTSQAMVAKVRQMAAKIRALPTSEVDPEAVQCGIDAAMAVKNLADVVEANNSPAVYVEAFLRGLGGDFFGQAAEMLDTQSALQGQFQQVQTELDNARAILSSRYGVEFPPIQ